MSPSRPTPVLSPQAISVQSLERRTLFAAVAFEAIDYYPAGWAAGPLVVGDFNSDEVVDLAVVGISPDAPSGAVWFARVLLGNGDGTFAARGAEFAVGPNASSVAAGDFNRDGDLDLAVANDRSRASVAVLLGNGDGTFARAQSFYAGARPQEIVVADVNRDGRLDVVAANAEIWSGEFTDEAPTFGAAVLYGNADGTFLTAQKVHTDGPVQFVRVADFNSDRMPDVLLAGPTAPASNTPGKSRVFAALGSRGGTFRLAPQTVFPGAVRSLAAGPDLNGDARRDAAVAVDLLRPGGGRAAVGLLFGRGLGTFRAAPQLPAGSPVLSDIAIADFDADGRPDLATAGSNPFSTAPIDVGYVSVHQNRGRGAFADPGNTIFAGYPSQLAFGRFNRDELPDVAITIPRPGQVGVLLNNTPAIFQFGEDLEVHTRAGEDLDFVPVARFTNTGGAAAPEDFRALIDWGDGTTPSEGTIVVSALDGFFVLGRHRYEREGRYRIRIEVTWPAVSARRTIFATAIVSPRATAGVGR